MNNKKVAPLESLQREYQLKRLSRLQKEALLRAQPPPPLRL